MEGTYGEEDICREEIQIRHTGWMGDREVDLKDEMDKSISTV